MARKLKGMRRKRGKWQAYIKVRGKTYTKTFPLSTPVEEMRDWRDEQQDTYGGDTAPAGGSFGDDIQTYLERVAAMPSYKQRAAHLELWAQELGRDRPRRSITPEEIEVVLQGWLETPTKPAPGQRGRPSGPEGLAPGTVRKRRTALQSFFAKMDGKKSRRPNPVKGTDNPKGAAAEARSINYQAIERAITAMPEHRSAKPDAVKALSLSRIRARVVAYTGLPPGLLMAVQPHDLQLTAPGTVRVRPRRKGRGVEARTLPLTAEGLAAFQAFHAAQAYGRFSDSALNRAFKRGCKRAGLDPKTVRLYDLRHSFLTEVYRATHDLATVARLGLHSEGSPITARYAKGANQAVDAAAVQAFSAALARQRQLALKTAARVQEPGNRLPAKAARGAKVNTLRHFRKRA